MLYHFEGTCLQEVSTLILEFPSPSAWNDNKIKSTENDIFGKFLILNLPRQTNMSYKNILIYIEKYVQ